MKLKNKKKGFTLIEVLLAAVVGAIVLVTVNHVLWTGLKVEERLRFIHNNFVNVLRADYILSRDLENAIRLDLSLSYPELKIFLGKPREIQFLINTDKGIKRVRYFVGRLDNSARKGEVETIFRQEVGLSDWVNHGIEQASAEVLLTSVEKDSFECKYAAWPNQLDKNNLVSISYKDQWSENGLPMMVMCRYSLFDTKNKEMVTAFQREMYLAPREVNERIWD